MNVAFPSGLGAILAILALVLAVVLLVVGQLDLKVGALLAVLAVARLT